VTMSSAVWSRYLQWLTRSFLYIAIALKSRIDKTGTTKAMRANSRSLGFKLKTIPHLSSGKE
jgi:hypothetical protein